MSQVNSGYARKEADSYPTPSWVTKAVLPHLDIRAGTKIWEPAAGAGQMADVLINSGHEVFRSDKHEYPRLNAVEDFLTSNPALLSPFTTWNVVTNPPYDLAVPFIEKALKVADPEGIVAMLLRVDFDSAKTRRYLFGNNPYFSKKVVLLNRIKWFDGPSGPSENHAWFIWDLLHEGFPEIVYAEKA